MNSQDEFDVIRKYFSDLSFGKGTVIGPGDDCAVLQLPSGAELATSCDTLIQGIHFPFGSSGDDVAYRAIATSASDLAAMGARPLACVLSLSLPSIDPVWLQDFREGLSLAVECFSLPLVGGDLTSGNMVITVTVYGQLPFGQALQRSGVQEGDLVLVSGTLGDATAGLAILQDKWKPNIRDRETLIRRFFRPDSRLELGASLLGVASAAIDISDGLLADAGHLAAQSGLAIEIEAEKIPFSSELSKLDGRQALEWALTGGDDYELCFTMPENQSVPVGCTQIGIAKLGVGVSCLGFDLDSLEKGYRHFK